MKLLVILGPTSSGKSALAINLAKKFNGEIISADSRQVYRGMDIGTGKVSKKEMKNIPHHLINVVSPRQQYSVDKFKKDALKKIKEIRNRGKLPIIVGGTAFYIYSVIDNLELPKVKPDIALRKQLENKSASELFKILKRLDPSRAKNIDQNNPRRLVRAIEIVKTSGKPTPDLSFTFPKHNDILILGIKKEGEELKHLIRKRVTQRIKKGLVNEVKKLRKIVSAKRLGQIGLTYSITNDFLEKKISKEELVGRITNGEYQYAKRQMTWFKKDPRIKWVDSEAEASNILRK